MAEIRKQAETALATPFLKPSDAGRVGCVRNLLAAFDHLPAVIRETVEARAKDNDAEIVRLRHPTESEIKQAKFYGRQQLDRVREVVARLEGLHCINPSQRVDRILDVRVPAIFDRMRSLLANANASADEFSAELRRLSAAELELERSLERSVKFFTPENVAKLALLRGAREVGIEEVVLDPGPPCQIRAK